MAPGFETDGHATQAMVGMGAWPTQATRAFACSHPTRATPCSLRPRPATPGLPGFSIGHLFGDVAHFFKHAWQAIEHFAVTSPRTHCM